MALIGIIIAANKGESFPVNAKVNPTALYSKDKKKLM